jgi:predicted 3-demethylubiquinone-9 3-methyltransferase (glyoxalase superfamily)
MQKIIPHLWFDKEAKEAAAFYISVFPDSKILSEKTLHDTPSGDADTVSFELAGYHFMAISAGPYFKINPSVSFMLNFDPSKDEHAKEKLDAIWKKLEDGGTVLMPLQKYPFSEYYGWIQDKYGVSWQLTLTNPHGEERPFIIPEMLFTKDIAGKVEEAEKFYMSVFKNSKQGTIAKYPAGMEPEKEGNIMFSDFMLENQWFAAMESRANHAFSFNEAISFLVKCDTQEEIDYYWEKLSAVPQAEQCGWLKDKYGFSWQISASAMDEMMSKGTEEQIKKLTQCFLKMKKINLSEIQKAFEEK